MIRVICNCRRILEVRKSFHEIMPEQNRKNLDELIQKHPEKITYYMKYVYE